MNIFESSFAVVRNPLSRLWSEYCWQRQKGRQEAVTLAFGDWVRAALAQYEANPYVYDNHLRPQAEFVGQGIQVFQFEEGLTPALNFALGKGHKRPRKKSARNSSSVGLELPATSSSTRREIMRFYEDDFVRFNYFSL